MSILYKRLQELIYQITNEEFNISKESNGIFITTNDYMSSMGLRKLAELIKESGELWVEDMGSERLHDQSFSTDLGGIFVQYEDDYDQTTEVLTNVLENYLSTYDSDEDKELWQIYMERLSDALYRLTGENYKIYVPPYSFFFI